MQKKITFILGWLILLSCQLSAQNYLATEVYQYEKKQSLKSVSLFELAPNQSAKRDYSGVAQEYLHLDLQKLNLENLYSKSTKGIELTIPVFDGKEMTLQLVQRDLRSNNFSVFENDNGQLNEVYPEKSFYYRGIVKGDPNSFVSLGLSPDQVNCLISTEAEGDITLALDQNNPGFQKNNYLLFRESDRYEVREILCDHNEKMVMREFQPGDDLKTTGSYSNCKDIEMKIYMTYRAYVHPNIGGNTANATTYIENLFYHVATIYRNENIYISISSIVINTSADTYTETSSSALLEDFGNEVGTTWNNTTDQVGHLIDIAGLGGLAWTDVLCLNPFYYAPYNTYVGPFAYSSVYGSAPSVPGGLPTWNWDVEILAHEMGHVLGSPHTHACSWTGGAIDNCFPVEGSCSPGADPGSAQGTIMSYCHLCTSNCSGSYCTSLSLPSCPNPGINLHNGFGPLPGNLIRNRVAAATCAGNYLPTDIPVATPGSITANRECTDGDWTFYYNDNETSDESDDKLLFAINKDGQDIGTIGDGTFALDIYCSNNAGSNVGTQITAPYTSGYTNEWWVMNRWWDVTPNPQPTTPVTIRFFYTDQDFTDVTGSTTVVDHSDMVFYKIDSPGDPNPDNNHGTTSASDFHQYTSSASPSTSTWLYNIDVDGNHYAEYMVTSFSGGGGGGSGATLPVELSVFSAMMEEDYVLLEWQTESELNNAYFMVQRSADGERFEDLYEVAGAGTTVEPQYYYHIDEMPLAGKSYYRLKQVDFDGTSSYSDIKVIENNNYSDVSIFPNPVKASFTLEINTPRDENLSIEIFDVAGHRLHFENQMVQEGNNQLSFDSQHLAHGIYFMKIYNGKDIQTIRFLK